MDSLYTHFRLSASCGRDVDLFAYEAESGKYLLYAPISGTVGTASKEDIGHIENLSSNNETDDFIEAIAGEYGDICQISIPDNITELTILLNQKCNFSCSYCYSAAGRSNKVIDEAQLTTILDFFITRERGDSLQIVFSGGGDPVLSFDKFKNAVEYAKEKSIAHNITLSIGIVTNGSTLTCEHVDFIRRHNIELVVSCDILEDIHNAQRSHYDIVADTIDKLCEAGIEFGIRSTITPLNVARQKEMVEVLHRRFPKVRSAAFEAVLNRDLFPKVEDLTNFYDTFIEQIFEARKLGNKYGITIGNTLINNVHSLKNRACLGKLVVTPYGDLTACSRIASSQETHFEDFVYGRIVNGKIEIDARKYQTIMMHNADNEAGCDDCIAKWHCGGGCLLARLSNPKPYMDTYCDFTRKMTLRAIFENYDMAKDWLRQYHICCYKRDLEPSELNDDDEQVILYSPIARRYAVLTEGQLDEFLLDNAYADIFASLADYIPLEQQRKVRRPEDYTLLTILPNNVCNFTCSYCYSAAGRNGSKLLTDNLITAIDFFIDSKPDGFNRTLTISFMGGGEPMLSWECVTKGVVYARQKALQRGFKLNLRIITNGSIVNEEIIEFLKLHHIEVSVSFEIIPEIQNLQRKNYDVVRNNIQRMLEWGIPVQINSTITPANVERMEEMIHIMHTQYASIKNAMFEPVVAQDMFASPGEMRVFYEKYIEHFCTSLKLADQYGIALTSFAYLRTVFPLERACPGELCLTADGDITGCYCVATSNEPLFELTKYGHITNGQIVFDRDKFQKLISDNVYSKQECQSCQVRWNCGGGCFHQYKTYTKPYQEEVCRFTKLFVEHIVRYKAGKFMRIKFGDNIPEMPIVINEIL